MARRIPSERIDELVRRATEVFIARGYRMTQMSDVAESVGVAKGTLYGYVESKDALLLLCLTFADEPGRIAQPDTLPIPAPPVGEIGQRVKDAIGQELSLPLLEAALARPATDDVREELRGVIGELFDLMASNRHRIKLLDRCMDHPELLGLWQATGRVQPRLALGRYFELRMEAGAIRRLPDPALAVRLVIETCATWAVHIHWDRAPEAYDPIAARDNAIDFLVRGLVA